jgi:hypothetical protein
MRTFRVFGHEVGFELWTGCWLNFKRWQFGSETLTGSRFRERLYWAGPMHFAVSKAS